MAKLAIFIGIKDNVDIITGGERQLQELIKALRRHGWETVFLEIKDVLKCIAEATRGYNASDVYVISDYSSRFPLRKIVSTIRKRGYHIICSVGSFYFDYRSSKIKNAMDYVVSYLYLRNADLIITTGEAVNHKLDKMGLNRVSKKAFYPAVRESLVEESEKDVQVEKKEPSSMKTILIVGRFHPVKGYDYLLDSIRIMRDREDLHFILVGDYERKPDEYYNHIKKRIEDENLSSRITIYGKTKDDKELAGLYRSSYCCLHTSVWESSPITVCEALLFGKPVIATLVGGTAEYLTDGEDSILVPSKDGKAIAEAIEKMCDEVTYKKMTAGAMTNSEKYRERTWTDVGEEYYEAINLE